MSHTPVLETKAVSRSFSVGGGLFKTKRTLQAVSDISIKIDKGHVLGLVGESGCGKSTLAMMLLGLLSPTKGSIYFNGTSLEDMPRLSISRCIQPVFQDPYSSLNPRKRISSIVKLPLEVHGIADRATRQKRVADVLKWVGIPPTYLNRYPGQLSGGQRQRIAIARALAIEPEVIICDEPTSALDVSVQAQILNLLLELHRNLDVTILLISHNLAVVEHLATEVVVMYLGRIVEIASAEVLFAKPMHPYSQALLASVITPSPGAGLPNIPANVSFPNPFEQPPGCAFHPRCQKVVKKCKNTIPALRQVNKHHWVACVRET